MSFSHISNSPVAIEELPKLTFRQVLCERGGRHCRQGHQGVLLSPEGEHLERGAHTRGMPLSPQAAALRGTRALVRITERGDDGAFLLGQMGTLGLPEGLDRPIPRPGT